MNLMSRYSVWLSHCRQSLARARALLLVQEITLSVENESLRDEYPQHWNRARTRKTVCGLLRGSYCYTIINSSIRHTRLSLDLDLLVASTPQNAIEAMVSCCINPTKQMDLACKSMPRFRSTPLHGSRRRKTRDSIPSVPVGHQQSQIGDRYKLD